MSVIAGLTTGLAATGLLALALALARRMRRRGQPPAAYLMGGLLCGLNPLAWEALRTDHAAELVAAVLCVGATMAALRRRSATSAALLGLALTAEVLVTGAPWPVLLGAPLTALWWRSPRRTPDDALALLALLFLVGSVVDPGRQAYESVPFLLSLVAWEGLTRRGLPVVALLSTAVIWAAGTSELHLIATLPVGAWLAMRLYLPSSGLLRMRAWPVPTPRTPATR